MMNCQPEDKKSKLNIVASAWDAISSRPLLLVVFAFCLFSIGIWNARDGFGEDTSSFITAYSYIDSNAKSALPSSDAPRPRASSPETAAAFEGNLLLVILTAMLNNGCDDPLLAALLLRILSSFLASIAVYFILSSFSPTPLSWRGTFCKFRLDRFGDKCPILFQHIYKHIRICNNGLWDLLPAEEFLIAKHRWFLRLLPSGDRDAPGVPPTGYSDHCYPDWEIGMEAFGLP